MTSSAFDQTSAWRAVQQRDRSFDGAFVYAVRSTRIFCRPSCASRRPTKSRVEFFRSAADAEQAGYRACKRCRPAAASRDIDRAIARATDYLKQRAGERVTLTALANEVGVSAFHLQRAFKRAMGVSPREFQDAERRRMLAARLSRGDTVSRATYEAGFGSSSRVYERALGMTPGAIRKHGAGQRIQYGIVDCPLGRLLVAYTERGVCSVAIGGNDRELERAFRAQFSDAEIHPAGPTIHEWIAAIVSGVETGATGSVPIDAQGTAFQWRVWKELQRIPRGTTLTGLPVSARENAFTHSLISMGASPR